MRKFTLTLCLGISMYLGFLNAGSQISLPVKLKNVGQLLKIVKGMEDSSDKNDNSTKEFYIFSQSPRSHSCITKAHLGGVGLSVLFYLSL